MSQSIRDDVLFLCDNAREGRRFGTRGASDVAFWAQHEFETIGLKTDVQHFRASGKPGHNVSALLRAPGSSKYVIVMASMDGVGTYDGTVYPGADANASGLVALMALARSLSGHYSQEPSLYGTYDLDPFVPSTRAVTNFTQGGIVIRGETLPVEIPEDAVSEPKKRGTSSKADSAPANASAGCLGTGGRLSHNVLFVALDGHNEHSAGAAALWDGLSDMGISKSDILMVVNLDTMGSCLAPPQRYWKDYLIILGGGKYEKSIASCNSGLGLHLYYDYYDSRAFTDMFYRRLGDQAVFVSHGVPSVMVTSGITDHTNKKTDVPSTLNFELLERRVELLRRWLLKL